MKSLIELGNYNEIATGSIGIQTTVLSRGETVEVTILDILDGVIAEYAISPACARIVGETFVRAADDAEAEQLWGLGFRDRKVSTAENRKTARWNRR